MAGVRSVPLLMMRLVSPVAVASIGAAIALSLTVGGEGGHGEHTVPARAGRATFSDDGGIVHVALDVAKADISTNLVIHGADGEALARFIMYRSGAFTVESAGSDFVRFIVRTDTPKVVQVGVGNSRAKFALAVLADGSADMRVTDPGDKPVYGVRITEEGDVLPHEHVPSGFGDTQVPGTPETPGRVPRADAGGSP